MSGKQFKLRPWRPEDVDDLVEFASNQRIAQNLRDAFPHPYTIKDAETFITEINKNLETQQVFAIEIDGRAAGSIGVFVKSDVYRKSAEIGYWLGQVYWGNGIMTEAVKQMTQYAFEHFDIVRLFAEPYAFNIGSRRVLEKNGYTCEGILRSSVYKFGAIHDSCMYSILASEIH